MDHGKSILKTSNQVIQEIEGQLESLLQRRIGDLEKTLEERIAQEREAARLKKEEIERDFHRERESVAEYRAMVEESERQRGVLLEQARSHFDHVIKLQSEIEGLAKSTVEEIQKINDIQQRIEGLRERTAERAAFLKKDLREKFGITAEVLADGPKPLSLDLDQELEKLRKIKELLAVESAAAGLGGLGPKAPEPEVLRPLETKPPEPGSPIPEIQDLIASAPPADEPPEVPEPAPMPEEAPAAKAAPEPPAEPEEEIAAALESYQRSEPANGSGEIRYFEKNGKVIVDGESIFAAVEKTLDEAQRLSVKLGMTESPKGQFFIKQELINWQEGLRSLFLRIIKMTEKKTWQLPSFTADILNTATLRSLLERLSMENWSNPDEFASFYTSLMEIKKAFQARLEPRLRYLREIKREIESR